MMDKYEIAQKILGLLDCDYDEIVDAIYKLADEVEKEFDNVSIISLKIDAERE